MAGFLAIRHSKGLQTVFNFSVIYSPYYGPWNVIAQIGYTPVIPVTVNFTNNGSIGGFVTTGFAIDFSGLLAGSIVNFINTGTVLGKGGDGGRGGAMSPSVPVNYNGANGTNGGTAILGPGAGRTFNVTNATGKIWGGGGGGGGGGAVTTTSPTTLNRGGGGGGGGAGGVGFSASLGGAAGIGNYLVATAGVAGGTYDYGVGGLGGQGADSAGDGGKGGEYGFGGINGITPISAIKTLGGTAGAAGKAISLNGGTINWISGSGSPNVKGLVS